MRFLVFLLFVSIMGKGQESDTLLPRILLIRNDTEKVNHLYKRGFAIRNSNPQQSFDYARLSEQAALQSGSDKHIAKSYNLLGVLYYRRGNYLTALNYHTKALKLRQACKDITGVAYSLTNLGNVYTDLKLYEKAEQAYLAAIAAYRQAGLEERISGCLLNIGTVKHHLKQYDAAIENYKLAEALTEANDYNTKAIFLTDIAQAYLAKGNIEKCIACNADALKLRIMADNNLETGDNYLNLGGAYVVQKDLVKAKYYLDTAYSIAGKYDYAELRHDACRIYALYYAESKDYEAAFYWQKKFNDLNDTIVMQQALDKQMYDFNELEKTSQAYHPAKLSNLWLLVTVFLMLIFIPFILIRYQR